MASPTAVNSNGSDRRPKGSAETTYNTVPCPAGVGAPGGRTNNKMKYKLAGGGQLVLVCSDHMCLEPMKKHPEALFNPSVDIIKQTRPVASEDTLCSLLMPTSVSYLALVDGPVAAAAQCRLLRKLCQRHLGNLKILSMLMVFLKR